MNDPILSTNGTIPIVSPNSTDTFPTAQPEALERPRNEVKRYTREQVKDKIFVLSDPEKMLCEVVLKTLNIHIAVKAVNERYPGKNLSVQAAKRWLMKDRMKEYMEWKAEQEGVANISLEEYVSELVKIAKGDRELKGTTPAMWKLLGDAKGFLKSEGSKQQVNVSVKLTDANGR